MDKFLPSNLNDRNTKYLLQNDVEQSDLLRFNNAEVGLCMPISTVTSVFNDAGLHQASNFQKKERVFPDLCFCG